MAEPNLYDLIRDAMNDWSAYNHATSPVQQAQILMRLNETFYKLRDMDLVWHIAEQKLGVRESADYD